MISFSVIIELTCRKRIYASALALLFYALKLIGRKGEIGGMALEWMIVGDGFSGKRHRFAKDSRAC